MHRNHTSRLIRRAVVVAMLIAAVAIGALAPGKAEAATSSGREPMTEPTYRDPVDRPEPSIAQVDVGQPTELALVPPPSGSPVLVDFTPEPEDGAGGVALFQAPEIDGLTVGSAAGPGAQASPTHYAAGEGCSIQCITSGVAYARGVGAQLEVTTSTLATITVIVDGPGFQGFGQSDPGQVTFGHLFDQLQPGQTYHAWAIAIDPSGHVSVAEGDFVTLERHVTVSMSHADVTGHRFGSSLFAKHQWIEGEWLEANAYGGMVLQQGDVVVWVEEQIVLGPVDRFLDLAVQLHERKDPSDCEEAWGSPFVEQPMVGHSGCDAWAYATLAVGQDDLDARPVDASSWVEHTLERTLIPPSAGAIPGDYGDQLSFTVDVELHVTYS